jgi:DNA invertase Pin-like site-specific DNA recombinase
MGRTIAYCRVSARDQNPQLQLDALTAHGYDVLFEEALSGKRGVDRPRWRACLSELEDGDTLVFWKSDRFGRSAAHVLTVVTELRERGVKVVSLTENFDLGTKEGRFMFAVLAAAAEYEAELRAERQAEGIAAARRRQESGQMLPGKKRMGRPRAVGPAELRQLRKMVEQDRISVTEAARTLKISRSTAYSALSADLSGNEGQGERHDHELTAEQPDQDVDRDELFDVIEDLSAGSHRFLPQRDRHRGPDHGRTAGEAS